MFIKDVSDRTEQEIHNEVELQTCASKKGFAPRIIETDYKTYIKMEKIDAINIADKYGEDIRNIPKEILSQIYTILRILYHECDIQYIDVTPYNFIECDGKVWVIDFGDAISVKKHWYLQEVFDNECLLEWNPDFK